MIKLSSDEELQPEEPPEPEDGSEPTKDLDEEPKIEE